MTPETATNLPRDRRERELLARSNAVHRCRRPSLLRRLVDGLVSMVLGWVFFGSIVALFVAMWAGAH